MKVSCYSDPIIQNVQGVSLTRKLVLAWLRIGIFHHLAQMLSCFCKNPICLSRIGQMAELPESKSTQPRSLSWWNTLYWVTSTFIWPERGVIVPSIIHKWIICLDNIPEKFLMRLFCFGAGGCGGHLLTPLMTIPTLQGEKSSDLSAKLWKIQDVPLGWIWHRKVEHSVWCLTDVILLQDLSLTEGHWLE